MVENNLFTPASVMMSPSPQQSSSPSLEQSQARAFQRQSNSQVQNQANFGNGLYQEEGYEAYDHKVPDEQMKANQKIMDHIIRKYKPKPNTLANKAYTDLNLTEEQKSDNLDCGLE